MYTLVGIITNSHGVKGGIKVFPYTYDKNRYKEYKKVYLGEEKEMVTIKSVSFQNNLVLLTFEEYNNINNILKFKNAEIFIKTEDRKVLEEGNYYLSDILGAKVYDLEENFLGEVVDIMQMSANDIYVIKNDNFVGNIPAVKEFIKEVDVENKTIHISPIKGMFDEN